jgi:hypothetical protein
VTAAAFAEAVSGAEQAAAFLLERVQRARGRLWDEGLRAGVVEEAFDDGSGDGFGPALTTLVRRRIRGVSLAVVRALVGWHRGRRPVDVLGEIPRAHEVLARQARGRRCVSLIDDACAAAHGDPRHPDGLSFLLHDLEHLEKFVDPAHHRGQVGFFRAVARALDDPSFRALEADFDATWAADRDYVISDMNGSAIFLFSVLKMKVNMATRRHLARQGGYPPPTSGPLTPHERTFVAPALSVLVHAMGLPPTAAAAAMLVSTRRDHVDAAGALLRGFEALAESEPDESS